MLRDIERYLERCAQDERTRTSLPFGKRRRLTYRERWYLKHGFKNPRPQKPRPAYAQDAAVNLQKHDEQYHGGQFKEGQRCKLRETMEKGDEADAGVDRGRTGRHPWVTPEMDAEYAEAFDAFEDAESRSDYNEMKRLKKAITDLLMRHARKAFLDSAVKDEEGDPKIVYHGTKKGGFTSFETDGAGKTRDTGAWFVDDASNARTYSGNDASVCLPQFTKKSLQDKGYLKKRYAVIDQNGQPKEGTGAKTEEEVRANNSLKEGETIEEVSMLEIYMQDSMNPLFKEDSEAVKYAKKNPDEFTEFGEDGQSCIYSVFVNMKDALEIDANGDNWDNIRTEWQVYKNGKFEESFDNEDEAYEKLDELQEANPDDDYDIHSYGQTSDELVRDARKSGAGYDGVIIKEVSDEGGEGYGYSCDANDYIVFDGRNIKMADMVTFDDYGDLIPLSQRFDFTKNDVRY